MKTDDREVERGGPRLRRNFGARRSWTQLYAAIADFSDLRDKGPEDHVSSHLASEHPLLDVAIRGGLDFRIIGVTEFLWRRNLIP